MFGNSGKTCSKGVFTDSSVGELWPKVIYIYIYIYICIKRKQPKPEMGFGTYFLRGVPAY
jgi:hypothetical protein